MALFRKKVNLNFFLGQLITYGFKLFREEFNLLILWSDLGGILSQDDRRRLLELSGPLLVASLIVGKDVHYDDKYDDNYFWDRLLAIYVKYVQEVLEMNNEDMVKETNRVLELIQKWNTMNPEAIKLIPWAVEMESLYEKSGQGDDLKFSLCCAFATLFSGDRERSLVAFRYAHWVLKGDMTLQFLKEYRVI